MAPLIRMRISQSEIAAAVETLAMRISQDFVGQDLMVVGVLTGSIVFVADLMRRISVPHQIGMVNASSYRGAATSPGALQVDLGALPDVRGKDVLLVDDIFDTGRTLTELVAQVAKHGPRTIRTAVLLWKTSRSEVAAVPDYFCFQVPDEFLVGYGLDFDNQYRHLPWLGVIESDLSEESRQS